MQIISGPPDQGRSPWHRVVDGFGWPTITSKCSNLSDVSSSEIGKRRGMSNYKDAPWGILTLRQAIERSPGDKRCCQVRTTELWNMREEEMMVGNGRELAPRWKRENKANNKIHSCHILNPVMSMVLSTSLILSHVIFLMTLGSDITIHSHRASK